MDILTKMATAYAGKNPISCMPLAQSGSHRRYYRFTFEDNSTLIGAFNDDVAENRAFFEYTRFFETQQLNVPTLLAVHEDQKHYLLNDLGTHTLYDKLCEVRKNNDDFQEVMDYYKKVVSSMPNSTWSLSSILPSWFTSSYFRSPGWMVPPIAGVGRSFLKVYLPVSEL